MTVTNSTGAIADSYSYTAYGKSTSSSAGDPNPFQYGGQFGYYSEYNGAVLCGHRWYDTHDTLRWLSRDPIGYDGGDNLYVYCGGDPINKTDPNGENPAGDKILKVATGYANSQHWADPPIGNGLGCSGFVWTVLNKAGFRPTIKNPSYKGKVLPTADDWASGNVNGWTIVPNSSAQPGDIIAYKKTAHNGPGGAVSSTGHCGFFEKNERRYRVPIFNWLPDDGIDYIGSSGDPEKVNDGKFNDTFGYPAGTYTTLRYTGPSRRKRH